MIQNKMPEPPQLIEVEVINVNDGNSNRPVKKVIKFLGWTWYQWEVCLNTLIKFDFKDEIPEKVTLRYFIKMQEHWKSKYILPPPKELNIEEVVLNMLNSMEIFGNEKFYASE